MKTTPIQPFQVPLKTSLTLQANEGMATSARWITILALGKITMLAAFCFLPWQAATVVTLTMTGALCLWNFGLCEVSEGNWMPRLVFIQHPFQSFRQRVIHRISQMGPRVQYDPGYDDFPREVRRPPFNGVRVLPTEMHHYEGSNRRLDERVPVGHRDHQNLRGNPQPVFRGPPPPQQQNERVPVGHRDHQNLRGNPQPVNLEFRGPPPPQQQNERVPVGRRPFVT